MKYGRTLELTCENGCAFVSSVYGSEVSFYHACQALLAHEKVIFARKKKKRRTYSRWGDSGDCGV